MTNEEKKAFQYYKECNEKDLENYEYLHEVSQKQTKYLEILLNLIEKQSKEIEELKTEKAKRSWVHIKENGEVEPLFYVSEDKIKRDYISKKKLYEHIEMLEKENCHETCGIKKLIDCGRQCSIGCTIKNIKKNIGGIKMDGQYVFEEIKQRYEKSNKYMLSLTYEDIGILIHIIEVLDKQLKKYEDGYNLLCYSLDNYISKDKIKAKIEEIEKRRLQDGECELALHEFQREAKLEVLQSLLKEEE